MYNVSLTSTGFHVSLSGVGAQGAEGASAYEHAIAGGYLGTEPQFNAYLADLPTFASAAANSAMAAAVSATSAEDSAESALTSAATAITKSDQASASAVAAATSAITASSASTAATSSAEAALASQNSATLSASTATAQAVIATTQADLSRDWATKTSSEVVAGQGFGALKYASDAAASAAVTVTKASEASVSAASAASSETVATTKASEASVSATNAASSETAATAKASEASVSATNAASSETVAITKASEASVSATNAAFSATVATTKASEASTSATNAASSEAGAINAASTAATHAGNAAITASAVTTHVNKAQQWADADLNVQVESGKYSAKHWAAQAQASVTGAIIYRGAYSAASGIYPPDPALGDYYKISDAGTLGGVTYAIGDSIIYNGATWDKIDSTDAVTSVAGRVGAVIVTKTDVGLANVDNTSDIDKPVSTATQAALNLKADLASPAFTGTPTGITKSHVGLGNVDNTSDVDKPVSTAQQTALNLKANLASPTFTGTPAAPTAAINTNTTQLATTAFVNTEIANAAAPIAHVGSGGTAHAEVVAAGTAGFMTGADKAKLDGIAAGAQVNTVTSVAAKTGEVVLVKADVGLSNVDNTSDVDKPVSTAVQTALNLKADLASPTFTGTVGGITKGMVGLGSVDNTSDASKPVSTATQTALNTKLSDAPSDGKTYGRKNAAWAEAAPLASPTFTGTPAAPTAAVGTNTTQLATTAHVYAERAATATLTNKTLTTPLITGTREVRVAMPANAIDLATGNLFTKTISGATTLTVSNVPTTGTAASFILELANAGSAAITWFSGVKWAGGTAPTLTASGVDVLGFYSHDGGTTWRGLVLAKDSK